MEWLNRTVLRPPDNISLLWVHPLIIVVELQLQSKQTQNLDKMKKYVLNNTSHSNVVVKRALFWKAVKGESIKISFEIAVENIMQS